jgi:hypothetical protein
MTVATDPLRTKAAPTLVDTRKIRQAEREAREWNGIMRAGTRVWCQEHGAEGIVRSPAWEHNAEPVVTVEIGDRERVVSIRRVHGVES